MVAVVDQTVRLLAQLIGIALLGGVFAAAAAAVYRWYVNEVVPGGLALLVGLAGVAVYLNTTTALGQAIGGSVTPTETETALFNIAAFAVGVGGAGAGRHLGDRFAVDVAETVGGRAEAEVGRLVRTAGRVIRVQLPTEIDDVVGYDPTPEATKETLAGKTFVFPRGLTVEELRERLVARLTADYAVGHVDVELTADGSIEQLGLGSRAAGIGPTLPPATNAVAVRADPAFAASTGDIVQLWETDPMHRVTTAELRGVAGDVATVAIDAADTPTLEPTTQYRLVTLPVEDRPDREFASLLRAADETFASVTVAAGSPLHGLPVGGLDLTLVAITPEDAEPVPIPPRDRQFAPGDAIFAIAAPEALRRLDRAARPLDPSIASDVAPPGLTDSTDTPAGSGSSDQKPATTAPTEGTSPATEQTIEATEEDQMTEGVEISDDKAGEDAAPRASDRAEDYSEPKSADVETTAGSGGEPDDDGGPDAAGPATEMEQEADDSADERSGADALDDISFENDSENISFEDNPDDVLDDLPVGDGDDDGAAGDENGDLDDLDPLSLGDDEGGLPEEMDDADTSGSGDAGDQDDEDSGGSKSFQELKEEFESGDADWGEDSDDSPGGDMRLDE